MKKRLVMALLCLALLATTVACGSSSTTDTSNLSVEEMQELIEELQEENEELKEEKEEIANSEDSEAPEPETWADDYVIAFTDEKFTETIQEHTGKSSDITYGDVKGITSFELNWCEDISSIKYFTSLEKLTINYCSCSDWTVLGNLTNLQRLEMDGVGGLTDLSMFTNLTNLHTLIIDCGATDISPLGELYNLKILTISGDNLTNLNGLENLDGVTSLTIESCENLTDISAISGMAELEELDIEKCENLTDISVFSEMDGLEKLNITKCESLSDISAIGSMSNLQILEIDNCDALVDVSPLYNSTSLKRINISLCDSIKKLTDEIYRIPSIQEITVSRCEMLTGDERISLKYIGKNEIGYAIWEDQDGEQHAIYVD